MFDFLDDMLKKPAPPAEPVAEETLEVVEEVEETEEEVVEEPAPPPLPAPAVVGEKPDVATLLADLWGVSVDQYNEALEEGKLDAKTINFVQKLVDDKYEAEKKLAELSRFEELPAVQESKAAEKLVETWSSNIDEWSEELFDTIPEEVKLLKDLGKKKTQELQNFIEEVAGVFLLERLKSGKKVINPLLVKGSVISQKIRDLSTPKKEVAAEVEPQPQVFPPAPKPSAKKIASLSGASPVPETPNLKSSRAVESFMDNISFFTMGHQRR